ncbi:MAG: AsmA-like C-terminal region-containing protein, partial [Acetobacterales bacterium]
EDGDDIDVRLDRVVVREGTVVYRDSRSGMEETVDALEAAVSAGSLQGPFEATGSLTVRDVPIGYTLNLGALPDGGVTPLALALMLDEDKAKLQFNGQIGLGASPMIKGRITGEAPDFAAALAAAGIDTAGLPKTLSERFALEATLEGSPQSVAANGLTLRLAGTQASGAVSVALGEKTRVDTTLNVARIDLEPWLAGLGAAAAGGGGSTALSQRAAGEAAPFVLPTDLAGQLDLVVGTVQWRGGQVRQLRFLADLEGGELQINQASALLPGGSDVALFGFFNAKDGQPHFDGQVEAVSENLRGALDWLGVTPAGVSQERLRNLALTARVRAGPQEVNVTAIDLRVDASRLTGGVTVALRERPAFGIGVKLDRLNLDSYLPQGAPATASDQSDRSARPAGDGQLRGPAGLGLLNGFDANLRADVGEFTVNGTSMKGLSVDGTLFGGELSVRSARVADIGGATANFTGAVSGFGGMPKLGDATLRVRAQDVRSLARLAGIEGGLPNDLNGRFALDLTATGTLSDLELDLSTELADARLAMKGQVAALALQPRFGLSVQASHPDLVGLLGTLGVDYRPALQNERKVAFTGQLRGDLSGLTLDDLDLAAGPVRARGTAGLGFAGARPRLTADLTSNEIVIDFFLPAVARAGGASGPSSDPAQGSDRWATEAIDFDALEALDAQVLLKAMALNYETYRVDQPKLDLLLEDGVLRIRQLDGSMFGGTFSMTGQVSEGALQADLAVKNGGIRQALLDVANIDLADGKLDFQASLAGRGRTEQALVSSLDGTGTVQVRDGVIRGFDLSRVSQQLGQIDSAVALLGLLEAGMGGGETRFSRLDGTFDIENGVARTDDLTIEAEAGTGKGVGAVNVAGWSVDLTSTFQLIQHPSAPPFGMRLVGPLDNPRKVFQFEKLQAYLLQRSAGRLLERLVPGAAPQQQQQQPGPDGSAPPPRDAAPSESQSGGKPRPEDLLKGILDTLGR